ncbi:mucin-2-like isoform X2 [Ostrea edulis]|uniref:mucin-2-like isoform X2 n=1 Tax=Ostrea edulis TaxID=37623 RepID=UPI0024AF746E|nr:mucin-2-like isoform X2 [Ostrea edulis]
MRGFIFIAFSVLGITLFISIHALPRRSQACAAAPADILFLLDSSRSEGASNFEVQKEFVSKFVSVLNIGPYDAQVSVSSISTIAYSFFTLNTYHNKYSLLNAIARVPYKPGGTNTFYALDMAEQYTFTQQHGDRPNAPNIVYVLTDGYSSNHFATHQAAQHLKGKGVKVFAIGIGRVSLSELIDMATDHEHVFTVDNFSDLPSIQHLVQATYCEVMNGTLCIDKISNCHRYPKNVCLQPNFVSWAQMYCPDHCGFCQIHTPAPPTVQPTTFPTTKATHVPTTKTVPTTRATTPMPTSTMKPTTTTITTTHGPVPQLIPEGACIDKISNCAAYGDSVCTGYRQWAIENCARFCIFCHDRITTSTSRTSTTSITTTTTVPSTTKRVYEVCEDKVDQCSTYGPDICFNYASWAAVQCPKFCVFCEPTTTTTTATTTTTTSPSTTPSSTPLPIVTSTLTPSTTQNLCLDVRSDCKDLGPLICFTNQTYAEENCAAFCNFCTPSVSNSATSNPSTVKVAVDNSAQTTSTKSDGLTSTAPSSTLTTNPAILVIGRR